MEPTALVFSYFPPWSVKVLQEAWWLLSCSFTTIGRFLVAKATRVMWAAPLRESFAVPFHVFQLAAVIHTLRQPSSSWREFVSICASSLFFLVPWQLSQFVVLTQILALMTVYVLQLLHSFKAIVIISALLTSLVLNALLLQGSHFILSSHAVTCAFSSLCIIGLNRWMTRLKPIPVTMFVEVVLLLLGTFGLKALISRALGTQDDAHIVALIWSKLTSYEDFYTLLYTCAPEFDFLPPSYVWSISGTLLFPISCLAVFLIIIRMAEMLQRPVGHDSTSEVHNPLSEWCYLLMQGIAFVSMATMFMRLKLFLTPYLAVISSLLASRKLVPRLGYAQRCALCGLLVAMASIRGIPNIMDQHNFVVEFNDPDLEQLVTWINSSTPPSSVFTGTIPTMATVKLTTERPIVNHPHFEHSEARKRSKLAYSVYSRKPATEIHATLVNMGVNFVIMEFSWCKDSHRLQCSLAQIWDTEDSANCDRPLFCESLVKKLASDQNRPPPSQSLLPHQDVLFPFNAVFWNNAYCVLKVQ